MNFKNKGETQLIGMGVGLITLIILGYIMFPVIAGVQNSITAPTNAALNGSYQNYTNSVAGAITLFGVSPIVYAAAIVLVILVVYLAKR
jgi:uncharacterized membrane protein